MIDLIKKERKKERKKVANMSGVDTEKTPKNIFPGFEASHCVVHRGNSGPCTLLS